MAYWIHADGEDPRQGFEFQTKVAARAHLAEAECPQCTGKMITFSASALEIAAWHNRERERMEAGTYQPAPWNGLDWEAGALHVMEQKGDADKPIWFSELGCPGVKSADRTNGWWLGITFTNTS